MKKSQSTSPSQEDISAAVKTGMSSLMSLCDAGEIPWGILYHSHYRDVAREIAERLVIENTFVDVLFRRSSVKGHLAVTTLNNEKEPIHFLLSNEELNERAASCRYYQVNMGNVLVELTHIYLSGRTDNKYQDFILQGIDQRVEAIKEDVRQRQKKLVEAFIVKDEDENDSYGDEVIVSKLN
ncbi:hypothetical protein [Legionella clemsonensis]|uniref:Uncharacterized protein n=1 Tax=Legionella clemsonensis TaxID=1867846 RepID=A0A222P1A1_9GAMM|nr:hypothetical protein [Legionella clemsonensis]ASQ45591.1 hypothetical protein clem_05175 [Legionella clemsonensis]